MQLIYAAISAPIVALGVIAGLGRVLAAQRAGDEQTVTAMFVSAAVVGSLLVVGIVAFVLQARVRLRTILRRFALLSAAFPEGTAFFVGYATVSVGESSSASWRALKPADIHAVAVDDGDLLIIKIGSSVEILARARRPKATVALGTREIYRMAMSQVTIWLESNEAEVQLGLVPSDVGRLAIPRFADPAHLAEAMRAQLGAH